MKQNKTKTLFDAIIIYKFNITREKVSLVKILTIVLIPFFQTNTTIDLSGKVLSTYLLLYYSF